jgi:hypothetical protein
VQLETDRKASIALARKQAEEERLASIAKVDESVESRLHRFRERLAEQKTSEYAAAERARLAQLETERQASIALARKQAEEERLASIAKVEESVESRLHRFRERLAEQKTSEDAAVERARLAQLETDRQASIALARKQAEEERLASIAKIEERVENRLHGSRERLAEQKTSEDAAAERARLAQSETERQASIALAQEKERLASIARIEAGVEDRLHGAREMLAEQKIAAYIAAERALLAQIETNRRASIAFAQKQAQEQERIASIARIEAGVENGLHRARERLADEKTAADAVAAQARLAQIETERQAAIALAQKQAQAKEREDERLASVAKIESGVENRLHEAREKIAEQKTAADAAAEAARLAQVEMESRIALAQKERLAAIAKTEAAVESRLHAARAAFAERTTADFEIGKRADVARFALESAKVAKSTADVATSQAVAASATPSPTSQPTSTGSISRSPVNVDVQKSLSAARREVSGINRKAAAKEAELAPTPHRGPPGSSNGAGHQPALSHVALAEPTAASSIAGSSEDVRVFRRRCPSILDSSMEYDDDLVAMCRGWASKR